MLAAQGNSINFIAELGPDCPLSTTSRKGKMCETLLLILRYMVVHHRWTLFICLPLVSELGQSLHPPPSFSLSASKANHHKTGVQSIQTNEGQEIPCSGPPELPPFLQATTADVVYRLNKIFRSRSKPLWCSFHMFYWS